MAEYPEIDGPRPVGAGRMVAPGQVRVRRFRRPPESGFGRRNPRDERPLELAGPVEKTVRGMIARVNEDFASRNLAIHLSLISVAGSGHLLEIYDCTDNQVCNLIKEELITVAQLPALIRELQREAGLLVNTVG